MNWFNIFHNPILISLQKFVIGMIGETKFSENALVVESISRCVHNEQDYERVGRLLATVYHAGYMKSVEDHERELAKLGIKVSFNYPTKSSPIFGDQEKST